MSINDNSGIDESFDTYKQKEDTGAAPYGNFINYYQFNSAEKRIELLPTCIWKQVSPACIDDKFIVLDVGCNAGDLTQILYPYLVENTEKNIYILGIDIDPLLIERCNKHNQFKENINYKCLNIMNCVQDIFNEYLAPFNRTQFDAIFCLSLTMWIHLNNGDDGLHLFLTKIGKLSDLLIVEPQPWKCYLSAVRRMRKSGKNFDKFMDLKVRNNVEKWIQSTITNNDCFTLVYETVPTQWDRKISFYEKIKER